MRRRGGIKGEDIPVIIGAAAFGLVGLLVLCLGASLYLRSSRLVREGRVVTGELVDTISRQHRRGPYVDSQNREHGPDGTSYDTAGGLLRFTDANGKTVYLVNPYIRVTGESDAAVKERSFKVGDQVPLRYLPDNPKEAELDDPFRLWTAPGLACGFGLVFLGAGFLTYKVCARPQ